MCWARCTSSFSVFTTKIQYSRKCPGNKKVESESSVLSVKISVLSLQLPLASC